MSVSLLHQGGSSWQAWKCFVPLGTSNPLISFLSLNDPIKVTCIMCVCKREREQDVASHLGISHAGFPASSVFLCYMWRESSRGKTRTQKGAVERQKLKVWGCCQMFCTIYGQLVPGQKLQGRV